MTESGPWSEEVIRAVRKYALQNAVEYDGSGQAGSVLGRLLSEMKELRPKARELRGLVQLLVDEANEIASVDGVDAVRKLLEETNPEALHREKQQKRVGLPELPNSIKGEVTLRFAPNPNGPLSLGHSRGVVINSELAKINGGRVVLRFDDTDTKVKPPEPTAYSQIEEEYEWISGKKADVVIRASDRMPIYLEYAEKMISEGFGYACRCTAQNFKKLRDNMEECPCRENDVSLNLELFESMKSGGVPEGGAVIRVKTSLDLPNPALRDWPALRIQHTPHPMVGEKYKVWPLLDFQSAIEDRLQGVTHIVRGKDLMDSTRKQTILYGHFGWDYPETLYWGRVKVLEFGGFSTSGMRMEISEGKYSGWDDPRLPTISAIRKRGFSSQAIREFWLELGLTQKDISIPMQSIEAKNSSTIDSFTERRSFVRNPDEVIIEIPDTIGDYVAEVSIPKHPDETVPGTREWGAVSEKIFVEKDDIGIVDIRLKGFADVKILDGVAVVISNERTDRRAIAHWLPVEISREAVLEIPQADEIQKVSGVIEDYELVEGMIVQLERVGFARIKKIPNNGPIMMSWLHG
ncbi:MAG: glutamate--tRNA ligase [Euryarchaeota archaeon]|jgi:glutamyl-tRNA synthetase|nr:glutamate--tRNA ligase [Euryarchaeota archaeon]|tara:strand:+ start:578 stop:2308 length:1731 start_codon:yes stop_codon:yes gene_type:complete